MKRDELAARGDLGERAGRHAGIGRHLEMRRARGRARPTRSRRAASSTVREARLLELQRRAAPSSPRHRAPSPRWRALRADALGGGDIGLRAPRPRGGRARVNARRRRRRARRACAAMSARRRGERRRRATLCLRASARSAKSRSSICLERRRVAAQAAQRRLELRHRLARLDGGALERGERRRRAARPPCRAAARAGAPRRGARARRRARRASSPSAASSASISFSRFMSSARSLGERVFLAGLRLERVELGQRVAQVILVGARLGERRLGRRALARRRRASRATPRRARRSPRHAAIGVERVAMGRRVEQAVLRRTAPRSRPACRRAGAAGRRSPAGRR